MSLITEEQVELQSIEWFEELGYKYKDDEPLLQTAKEKCGGGLS